MPNIERFTQHNDHPAKSEMPTTDNENKETKYDSDRWKVFTRLILSTGLALTFLGLGEKEVSEPRHKIKPDPNAVMRHPKETKVWEYYGKGPVTEEERDELDRLIQAPIKAAFQNRHTDVNVLEQSDDTWLIRKSIPVKDADGNSMEITIESEKPIPHVKETAPINLQSTKHSIGGDVLEHPEKWKNITFSEIDKTGNGTMTVIEPTADGGMQMISIEVVDNQCTTAEELRMKPADMKKARQYLAHRNTTR